MGQPVQGNRQHDNTDRGSPVKIGGKASTATPTAVGDGDRVDAYFTTDGRLVVKAENAAGGDIGGGTQYAEDTAHVSGDQVTMAGVVQQAADAALSTDLDRSLMQVDASGWLKVNVKAGSAGGVSHVDDAAFTPATDDVVPAAAMFDDVTPDSVDEGDAGVLRMSANRNLYTQIRDLSAERSAAVTAANALKTDGSAVTQPVSGTVTANLAAGVNNIGDVDVLTLPALPAGTNNIGDVDVLSIAAGSNLIGDVGIQGRTSGGLTMTKLISAATTNATLVKGSAGQIYAIQAFNNNAEERFLKLYNKATAPTVGTDTPVKTLMIPGATTGAGFVAAWVQGLEFTLGIGFALTTGIADADTGAVAASEIVVNIDYE